MPLIDFKPWENKAHENLDKWGMQDKGTLILAMVEELGELSQAYLQHTHEDGDYNRIEKELDDLAALCIQMKVSIMVD